MALQHVVQRHGTLIFITAFIIGHLIFFRESLPHPNHLTHKIQHSLDHGMNLSSVVPKINLSHLTLWKPHPQPAPTKQQPPTRPPRPDDPRFHPPEAEKWNSNKTFEDLTLLCGTTKWRAGVWLHCQSTCENETSICGGFNEARTRIQTCTRLAIDAGTGLILPSLSTRNSKLLRGKKNTTVCPDTYFDVEYLRSTMDTVCPQLKIRGCDDRSGISNEVIGAWRGKIEVPHVRGQFRDLVDTAFENYEFSIDNVSVSNPAVVSWGDAFAAWDYNATGEMGSIRKALFKALTFNQSLLDLGSEIFESPELSSGPFIGVHLRGERDWPAVFGNASFQVDYYVKEIERINSEGEQNISTVYFSCGDPTPIHIFRTRMVLLGYTVVDKWSLLGNRSETFERMDALNFDQKGIVEYQTLVGAKVFIGIMLSTFSCLVAFARSLEHEEDFFEKHIFPNTTTIGPMDTHRMFPGGAEIRGDEETRLLVQSGPVVMNWFP